MFTLRHEEGDPEAETFFSALASLAAIDGVETLELVRQVSVKNGHQHGVVMDFADVEAYAADSAHPDHVAFVRDDGTQTSPTSW